MTAQQIVRLRELRSVAVIVDVDENVEDSAKLWSSCNHNAPLDVYLFDGGEEKHRSTQSSPKGAVYSLNSVALGRTDASIFTSSIEPSAFFEQLAQSSIFFPSTFCVSPALSNYRNWTEKKSRSSVLQKWNGLQGATARPHTFTGMYGSYMGELVRFLLAEPLSRADVGAKMSYFYASILSHEDNQSSRVEKDSRSGFSIMAENGSYMQFVTFLVNAEHVIYGRSRVKGVDCFTRHVTAPDVGVSASVNADVNTRSLEAMTQTVDKHFVRFLEGLREK